MADLNLGTQPYDLNKSRFISRIEFHRATVDGDITGKVFLKDTFTLDSGELSGSILAQHSFEVTIKDKHLKVTGFGTFFNNFLTLCNNIMSEYYQNGTLHETSGSLNTLTPFTF